MSDQSFLSASQAQSIAREYGTPVYVYREDLLHRAAQEVLSFPHAFGLTARFAMKACPNAAILQLFDEWGLCFDASSEWEARRALQAGIDGKKISLSSQEFPQNLRHLVDAGVEVNACSLNQLRRFGEQYPGHAVGIRINPGAGSGANNRTNTGGPASSFGIWHGFANEIQAIAKEFDLHITRIHTHIGSGGDPALWQKTAELSLKLVPEFPEVTTVNLGGGFKVARIPGEPQADLQQIGPSVRETFERLAEETGRQLHLEIEPGTFLTANAGAILSQVTDVVSTSDYSFIKVDSGMTEILRPSMYGSRHTLRVFSSNDSDQTKPYVVSGHCCESGDILTPAAGQPEVLEPLELPETSPGDLLLIEGAGAYCASMPAVNYNSFPAAPEVLIRQDQSFALIRKRQTLDQITANELPLNT